jgi:hypothetical protein
MRERDTPTAREENRFIKSGSAVGSAIKNLAPVVFYRTFCRWTAAVATRTPARSRADSETATA